MNKLSFLFISILILIFVAGCNQVKLPGTWTENRIMADGLRDDWKNIPFNFFKDQNIVMALCNDSNYLNIYFSFTDQKWLRDISRKGLTFWLSGNGKKNKDFGIVLRGGPDPSKLIADMPDDAREKFTERKDFHKELPDSLPQGLQMIILDKKNNREIKAPLNGDSGPKAGYADTNNIYTYEISIPISDIRPDRFGIVHTAGKNIEIGAEWGVDLTMNRPFGNKDSGFDFGGGGSRPGSPPSGGLPGGGGGRPGDMQKPAGHQEVWIKTTPAEKPGSY